MRKASQKCEAFVIVVIIKVLREGRCYNWGYPDISWGYLHTS